MVNVPSASDLKTRYPEFDSVDDARVGLFITEATGHVDETWIERDQPIAILSLACHQLSLENEPAASNGSLSLSNLSNGKFMSSRKVGDVSKTYSESSAVTAEAAKSATASQAGYRSTAYGKVYLRLLKLNHSGMRVV